MNILLIKQTSLGDVLHITPVIRAIKKYLPESNIDVVVDKRAFGILKNNPYINHIYVIDIYGYERDIFKSPKSFFSVAADFLSHIKEVRKTHYNIAIDLQGLERSMAFLYFSKADKKYAKGKWLFVESNYYDKNTHAIKGYLSFLNLINIKDDSFSLDYFLADNTKQKFENTCISKNIKIDRDYILISPFSRWKTKDLSVKKAREIIERIKKNTYKQIVISATEDYKKYCDDISFGFENVLNISGVFNLDMLAYLIKNAYGVISVDSFPMHTASAFNTPLIAIFGPTSEERIGPLSEKSSVIRVQGLECEKCYKRKNCPNNHICIEEIDANLVISKLLELAAK